MAQNVHFFVVHLRECNVCRSYYNRLVCFNSLQGAQSAASVLSHVEMDASPSSMLMDVTVAIARKMAPYPPAL